MIESTTNSENEAPSCQTLRLIKNKQSVKAKINEDFKMNSIKNFPSYFQCYVKLKKIDGKPIIRKWFMCSDCTIIFKGKKSFTCHLCKRHLHLLKSDPSLANNKENESILKNLSSKASKTKEKRRSTSLINDRIFTCTECMETFEGEIKFEEHYKTHHSLNKNAVISCSRCTEKFSDKEKLFWHLQMFHYPFRTYKCSECDIVASCRPDLLQHMKKKHVNTPVFQCWACDMFYVSDEELIEHFEDNHFKM